MAKSKRNAKRTYTIKLMTWTHGKTDDVLTRVDTFSPTFNGIAKLVAALKRRGMRSRTGEFLYFE